MAKTVVHAKLTMQSKLKYLIYRLTIVKVILLITHTSHIENKPHNINPYTHNHTVNLKDAMK